MPSSNLSGDFSGSVYASIDEPSHFVHSRFVKQIFVEEIYFYTVLSKNKSKTEQGLMLKTCLRPKFTKIRNTLSRFIMHKNFFLF